jgi:putative DNA primase/helicase
MSTKRPRKPRLSDIGNARLFVAQHGSDLRYVPAWSAWLVWDGRRWRKDELNSIYERAKKTVLSLYELAAAEKDDERRKRIVAWARTSENVGRIEAMIRLARTEPGIPIATRDIDVNRWLLNVNNGTINLRTGKLRLHRRQDLITKIIPLDYDPAAVAPTWDRFLNQVTDGSDDLVGFLQRGVGYSLTGETTERVVFLLYGVGRNGKSTFLEVIRAVLNDYAMRAQTSTLMSKRFGGGIPNDVARLKGARFVTASEGEEGQRLDVAQVKDMTGGDMLSARFLFNEFFEFHPDFKLWFGTNHKPEVPANDEAIWDRLRLIPFIVRIPESEVDKSLRSKLLNESGGILTWAVRGCVQWQRGGLRTPQEVREATAQYREEMDALADFIDDRCIVRPDATVSLGDLYSTYVAWHICNGEGSPLSKRRFSERIAERGARKHKSGEWKWEGIGLRVSKVMPVGSHE